MTEDKQETKWPLHQGVGEPIVTIKLDGTIIVHKEGAYPEIAKIFWSEIESEGKPLYKRIAELESKLSLETHSLQNKMLENELLESKLAKAREAIENYFNERETTHVDLTMLKHRRAELKEILREIGEEPSIRPSGVNVGKPFYET